MTDIFGLLVYDSWTQTLPQLRSSSGHIRDRHLIFEGNGLILDLLLKNSGTSRLIQVGGQILPGSDPLSNVSHVHVCMEQGGRRSSTHTNALGEFAFQAVQDGSFDVVITLKDRRFIVRGLSNDRPRTWRVVTPSA
jgi:hypothetical protein